MTTSVARRLAAFQTAPANPQMEKQFMTIANSLAPGSSHPGKDSIERVANSEQLPHCEVLGFQDFPGKGFGGAVRLPGEEGRARASLFGNRAFMKEAGLQLPDLLEVAARRWEEEGAEVLMGGWDGYVRGLMKFVSA